MEVVSLQPRVLLCESIISFCREDVRGGWGMRGRWTREFVDQGEEEVTGISISKGVKCLFRSLLPLY